MKHSGNEAPFKANEAALAAYERAISKPPPSAAGWCVLDWIYVRVSRQGGKNASLLLWLLRFEKHLAESPDPCKHRGGSPLQGEPLWRIDEIRWPRAGFLKV